MTLLRALLRRTRPAFLPPCTPLTAPAHLPAACSPLRPPLRPPPRFRARGPLIAMLTPPSPAVPGSPPPAERARHHFSSAAMPADSPAAPVIDEDDIQEQFVRGSGAGGQKINKTASCVVLRHKPSGIVVRCQETRSQHRNRELARRTLQRKLDDLVRGEASVAAQELSKARARKTRRRRKSVKKHFKSRRDQVMMDSRMD